MKIKYWEKKEVSIIAVIDIITYIRCTVSTIEYQRISSHSLDFTALEILIKVFFNWILLSQLSMGHWFFTFFTREKLLNNFHFFVAILSTKILKSLLWMENRLHNPFQNSLLLMNGLTHFLTHHAAFFVYCFKYGSIATFAQFKNNIKNFLRWTCQTLFR